MFRVTLISAGTLVAMSDSDPLFFYSNSRAVTLQDVQPGAGGPHVPGGAGVPQTSAQPRMQQKDEAPPLLPAPRAPASQTPSRTYQSPLSPPPRTPLSTTMAPPRSALPPPTNRAPSPNQVTSTVPFLPGAGSHEFKSQIKLSPLSSFQPQQLIPITMPVGSLPATAIPQHAAPEEISQANGRLEEIDLSQWKSKNSTGYKGVTRKAIAPSPPPQRPTLPSANGTLQPAAATMLGPPGAGGQFVWHHYVPGRPAPRAPVATGEQIGAKLVPNHSMKTMIQDFKKQHGDGEKKTLPLLTDDEEDAPKSIHDWLSGVNPHLSQYASALVEYGYDDTEVLVGTEMPDLEEALEELVPKKPHRALIRCAFKEMKEQQQ